MNGYPARPKGHGGCVKDLEMGRLSWIIARVLIRKRVRQESQKRSVTSEAEEGQTSGPLKLIHT